MVYKCDVYAWYNFIPILIFSQACVEALKHINTFITHFLFELIEYSFYFLYNTYVQSIMSTLYNKLYIIQLYKLYNITVKKDYINEIHGKHIKDSIYTIFLPKDIILFFNFLTFKF